MTKKYNYMKDYELAAKYGVTPEQYVVDSSKVWAMTNIANELNEMNRLKRLEMSKLMDKQINFKDSSIEAKLSPFYTKEELEDRA